MNPSQLPAPTLRFTSCNFGGFAANNAMAGDQVSVLVRAALTSDSPEFYAIMKSLGAVLTAHAGKQGKHLLFDSVCALLLVVHDDDTAELFLQNIPMEMEVLVKNDMAAGQVVYQSGVADVRRVRIPGLTLKPSDSVLLCYKVGWKFALFFDLDTNALDVDAMEREVGRLHRHLLFQDLYEALSDNAVFSKVVAEGWFPFVEIIGGAFEELLKAYRESFDVEGRKAALVNKFDAQRIDNIAARWWKRPSLAGRKDILQPAFDAFKRGEPVPCLKIILTEIEGVLQEVYRSEHNQGTWRIEKLLHHASEMGLRKSGDERSLLFPGHFLRYLSDYTYADFDPANPDPTTMSRHSVGHGAAPSSLYTPERALQAILTLDQISFYL